MKPIILIPAYNPDGKLMPFVEALRAAGYERLVIVNDGSKPECAAIFDALADLPGVYVLHHAINLGKGRALKTAFNFVLQRLPQYPGVITCDADGQHPVAAVNTVAEGMARHPDCYVLGVRQFFKASNVPGPNLAGNTITRLVFFLLTGMRYGDTQCGLRGYPRAAMQQFVTSYGERFEFENQTLLDVRSKSIPVAQAPMDAVYLGKNETSHFNRRLDPFRIYGTLLRFALPAIVCAIGSFLLFLLALDWAPQGPSTAYCAAAQLVTSLLLSLSLPKPRAWKPWLMCAVLTALGTGFYALFHLVCHLPPVGAWWLMAVPMAPLSYSLYLHLRFGRRPENIREDR